MTSRQKHALDLGVEWEEGGGCEGGIKLVLTGMKIQQERTDMRVGGGGNQSGLNTPLPTDGLMASVGV